MSNAVLLSISAATSEDGGMPVPSLNEFFPPAILFEGTPFEFNRIQLVRIIAMLVLILLFWLASRRAKVVPGRGQNMAEMLLDFIRVNIADEVLGKDLAKRFLPLLTILFLTVLSMNITGVIPGLNIAGTSVIGLPLIMAIVAYIAFIYAGIRAQGTFSYFKNSIFPPGVPKPIYVILSPIELVSTFVIRPATLTIRLLANMISGHLLLVTFFLMTQYLFFTVVGALKVVGVLTFAAAFAFTLFEIFVAALQAYVFTLLTAVYISLSVSAEH